MFPIAQDMAGALDAFFADQAKQPGKCLVDYVQFDHRYDLVFEDKPVSEAKAQLKPSGSTALLDAIGRSVTELGNKFANMSEDERPGTVVVVVITDGYENSSLDWSASAVKELIEQQETEWNWDFNFLGAGMDAVDVGTSYGFKAGKSMTYSTGNTHAMASAVSASVTRTRTGLDSTYTAEERQAQK